MDVALEDATASTALEAPGSAHAPRGRQLQQSHSAQLRVPHGPQPPAPYLDVLSLQTRRLLSHSQAQIAVRSDKQPQSPQRASPDDASASEVDRLEELLASVHLLVEPLQIPDLSHTGVFHSSTSQLQATAPVSSHETDAVRLSLGTIDKDTDVKLFYPTGAKKANMREYIKETLQRHLAGEAATASCGDLPVDTSDGVSDQQHAASPSKHLGASASAPVFAFHGASAAASPSPTKAAATRSKRSTKAASPSPLKHRKSKVTASPKAPACGSPLLNPELTRQAKDIIAAIRANSSKINELIGS